MESGLMGDGNDLLPPPVPSPSPERSPRTKDLRCGFCESTLTPSGEVIKLSERAKALRDFEDDLEDAKKETALLRQTIEDLQKAIDSLNADNRKLAAELKKASKFW